jgi:hypothetical protein
MRISRVKLFPVFEMLKLSIGVLVLLMCSFGCTKRSEVGRAYRRSADGSMQVMYINARIALIKWAGVDGALIVSASWSGQPSSVSLTGDRVKNVLVERVTSLNTDEKSGVIYGSYYPAIDKKGFFLIDDKVVTFFASEEELAEKLLGSNGVNAQSFLAVEDFIVKTRSRGIR